MRLSSFNIPAMLFALATGIALGALTFQDITRTNAGTDGPVVTDLPSRAVPVSYSADERKHPTAFTHDSGDAKYLGVIFTRQSADITARSEAMLEAVYVNLGDRLKTGDIIARIESHSMTQQAQMAEAGLRFAEAEQRTAELELSDAQSRHRRRSELAEWGLISSEDFASSRIQLEKAETRLQAAQARVAEQIARASDVRESLSNTVIRAPFDGTVAARYLDAGAAVRFGTPIVSLIRAEDIWIRFAIPETQRVRVAIGSVVEVQLENLAVRFPATIEYVSPAAAASSQERLAEARLNVPADLQEQIRPGGSGLVHLRTR